jgi:PAS domain S-box-containing protein
MENRETVSTSLQDLIFQWGTVIDAIDDCICLLDADFNIVKINKSLRGFLGKTEEEIIGKHCWGLVHGTTESPDFCPMTKMMKNKKRESADIELAGRYVRVTVDPILDEDGSIKGAIHIIRDIDESERKNIAVRESEKKYRLLVDSAAEAILVAQDGMLRLVNPMAAAMTGFSEQELMSKPFLSFIHPEDRAMVMERHQKRLGGEAFPNHYGFRLIIKDGSIKWVEISAVSIEWEGRPATLNFLTDVTERKQAEDRLRESEAELNEVNATLREERDRAQHYLNDARSIIVTLDGDGNVKLINKKGCEILGRSESDILGKDWFDNFIPENIRTNVRRVFNELMAGRIENLENYDNTLLASDGRILMISWHNALLKDESGKILGTLSAGEDISERLQMVVDLKVAAENLTRINTSLIDAKLRSQTYFDFLAHDIANIISPIMAYAELMSKRDQYPPEVVSFTEKIVNQAQKATSLIHNLRKLEMLEEKNLPDMNIVDIKRIFSFIENSIRHKYPEKKPKFVYHLPEDIPIKSRGGEYIDFVMRHVFDNAVRHSHRETVNIDVRIDKEGEDAGGKFWRILIEDDGPGISDRMKKEIMTPLDPAKRYSRGVASSLAFCSAAVIGIGGELQIEDRVPNDQSKGTRVIVWIPVYD